MGRDFQGVYDLVHKQVVLYQHAERGRMNDIVTIESLDDDALDTLIGTEAADKLREDVELVSVIDAFDRELFLAGKQTPVFFGSAINNFGVRELDAIVEHAPEPQPRATLTREVLPREAKFSGFCFKIQANLDKSHHDRMAFVRITSGVYERGMKLKHVRQNKMLTVNNATTFSGSGSGCDRRGTSRRYYRDSQSRWHSYWRYLYSGGKPKIHRHTSFRA